jgi:tetratricopeptide (TPR) repeat protein
MKKILLLSITLFSLTTFGQKVSDIMGQQMTLDKWNEEAKTNIRLIPKYGYITKTEEQKKADQEFIESVIKTDSTPNKASNHLISLGFKYLYRDVKTAMYRFNQAYLLDSTNTDIYWGFGGIYMVLGDYANAEKQYLKGLALNPQNTHLLTDYGTYFLAQYSILQPISPNDTLKNLPSAISYLNRSYLLDPKDQNTTFKLSVCYLYNSDCDNAWKFYNECKALGGQPITEEYTNTLNHECKRGK